MSSDPIEVSPCKTSSPIYHHKASHSSIDYRKKYEELEKKLLRVQRDLDKSRSECSLLKEQYDRHKNATKKLSTVLEKLDLDRFEALIDRVQASKPTPSPLPTNDSNNLLDSLITTTGALRDAPPPGIDKTRVVWYRPTKKDGTKSEDLFKLPDVIRKIDGSTTDQLTNMRSEARDLLTSAAEKMGSYAETWRRNQKQGFSDIVLLGLEQRFPDLRLCQGHWKTNALVSDVYPHWRKSYRGEALEVGTGTKRKEPTSREASMVDLGPSKSKRTEIDTSTKAPSKDIVTPQEASSFESLPNTSIDHSQTTGIYPLPIQITTQPFISRRTMNKTTAMTPPIMNTGNENLNGRNVLQPGQMTAMMNVGTENPGGMNASTGNDTAISASPPAIAPALTIAPATVSPMTTTAPAPVSTTTGTIIPTVPASTAENAAPTPTSNAHEDIPIDPVLLDIDARNSAPTSTNSITTPELQKIIDEAKKNENLWLGTARLYKNQNHVARFRSDVSSAENLCGLSWKENNPKGKTSDFVSYWGRLDEIEKGEWFLKSKTAQNCVPKKIAGKSSKKTK